MSGSESSNTSDDDDREVPTKSIVAALYDLCKSDELSITTLRETINQPGLMSPIYGESYYDHKYDPDKTLFVFHHMLVKMKMRH